MPGFFPARPPFSWRKKALGTRLLTSPHGKHFPFSFAAQREKISSAACPTPGCKGIGHVKGAKYSTHHSTFGCPYSLQNLNKESCLVDRLSNNSMTEESDWSYASKQKLAVVKSIKGKEDICAM